MLVHVPNHNCVREQREVEDMVQDIGVQGDVVPNEGRLWYEREQHMCVWDMCTRCLI